MIKPDTCFGDADAGEMFLNYPLVMKIRPYVGIGIIVEDKEQLERKHRVRWAITLMGFKPSP
eukprot:525804-Ditylum_brightwellii.AAC.1